MGDGEIGDRPPSATTSDGRGWDGCTCVVTGAAGFIGSALSRRLLALGAEVIIIDDLSTGRRENVPAGARFIEADCGAPGLRGRLEGVAADVLFHVAGQSSGEISFDNPVVDLRSNAESTLRLLTYARSVDCRRFVYASTMSVYGVQATGPVAEGARLAPESYYGVGKVASENYMRLYAASTPLQATALRLFNVYGPGQNLDNLRQGMASIYLAMAIQNRRVVVRGSADRYRDFVYIDDVVDSFLRAAVDQDRPYDVYNVGTGSTTTVAELLELIVEALPFEVAIEFADGTPGDIFGIQADITRIQAELGWSPQTQMREGITRMVNWALRRDGEIEQCR